MSTPGAREWDTLTDQTFHILHSTHATILFDFGAHIELIFLHGLQRACSADNQIDGKPVETMSQAFDSPTMLELAERILAHVYRLDDHLKQKSISQPCLAVGATTALWSSHSTEIESPRGSIIGMISKLARLLVGPHEFLHEYVSSNWEHGALYTILEFNILEMIPLDGNAHLSLLASQSGLPEKKLLSILRLISCEGILDEVSKGLFAHTAISEELVRDEKFKAWVGFQYVLPIKLSFHVNQVVSFN